MVNCRVTYVRKHSYTTKSNAIRIVKVAGSKMSVQHKAKVSNGVKCGECGCILAGLRHVRPFARKWLPKNKRTVARAYGGVRCHKCVQNKILRSFLISEHNLLKQQVEKKENEAQQKTKETQKKAVKKTAKKTQKK